MSRAHGLFLLQHCTEVLVIPSSVMATTNLFPRQSSYPGAEKTMPHCELTQDLQMWCNFGVPVAWSSQTHWRFQLAWTCQPESMRKTGVKSSFLTMFQDDLKDTSGPFPGDPVVRSSPSNAGGAGCIPGQGAKLLCASWPKKTEHKQQKQYCNKLNEDSKNSPN